MEITVTSYKDRRKSPCETAAASLRFCFEHFALSTGFTRRVAETLLMYPFFSVASAGCGTAKGLRYVVAKNGEIDMQNRFKAFGS